MPSRTACAVRPAARFARREALTVLGAAGLLATFAAPARGSAARLVEHAGGRTPLPVRPGRVACTYGAEELHAALLLRVNPVLAARGPADAVVDRLGYRLDDVPRHPFGAIDREMLAAARPDVILHVESIAAADLAALSAVAPVVLVDRSRPVDEQLRLVGAALGRNEDAERSVAGHAYRLGLVAEVVAASVLAGATVAVVAPTPADALRLLGPDSPAGAALRDVGVGRVLGSSGALAEADVVLRASASPAAPVALETDPRWARLPAVAAGRVAGVDGEAFLTQSALVRLARLEEIERVARLLGAPS